MASKNDSARVLKSKIKMAMVGKAFRRKNSPYKLLEFFYVSRAHLTQKFYIEKSLRIVQRRLLNFFRIFWENFWIFGKSSKSKNPKIASWIFYGSWTHLRRKLYIEKSLRIVQRRLSNFFRTFRENFWIFGKCQYPKHQKSSQKIWKNSDMFLE